MAGFRKGVAIACAVALTIPTTGCGWRQKVQSASAAKECDKVGYTLESGRHQECVVNTVASYEEQRKQQVSDLLIGSLLVAGAIGAAQSRRPAPAYPAEPPRQVAPYQSTYTTSGYAPDRERTQLCPDGSYVYAERCELAPDGTYVGGRPQLAPDGRYVAGSPRLAPNGTYVGGGGRTTICPDGSYVGGTRCILTPNGRYVGGP